MRQKYNSLNIYFKIVVWSVLLMIITTLISLYFIVNKQGEVPFGILIGLAIGAFLYSINGIMEVNKVDSMFIIASNFIRILLFGGALFGFAWLYYKSEIHAVNIFGIVGGYTAVILIFVALTLIDRKGEK